MGQLLCERGRMGRVSLKRNSRRGAIAGASKLGKEKTNTKLWDMVNGDKRKGGTLKLAGG